MKLRIRHLIEYWIFNLLFFTVGTLSAEANAALGRWFGRVLFRLGLRKKVVLRNLELAFKEKTAEEREAIALACYQNISSNLFEFLKLGTIPVDQIEQFIEFEGAEILEDAFAENKGVMIAGSHFGHWELLTLGVSQLVLPFHAYTGKQTNPMIDQKINQIRERFGMIGIPKSSSSNKKMLLALRKKKPLAILGDLNVPHQSLFVEFFGIKSAAGSGLGRFVSHSHCPLVFVWITRKNATQHIAHFKRIEYPLSGNTSEDTQKVTQLYFDELESNIRQYPDHYFWFNRRFKTRPESEDGLHLYEKMD